MAYECSRNSDTTCKDLELLLTEDFNCTVQAHKKSTAITFHKIIWKITCNPATATKVYGILPRPLLINWYKCVLLIANTKFNYLLRLDVCLPRATVEKRVITFITMIEQTLIVDLFFTYFTVEDSFVEEWRVSQGYGMKIIHVFYPTWIKCTWYTYFEVTANFTSIPCGRIYPKSSYTTRGSI